MHRLTCYVLRIRKLTRKPIETWFCLTPQRPSGLEITQGNKTDKGA